jgi:UDP-glucose 4-epimerase
MQKILVTGGLGYIGSHICVELVNAGYTPVIIDNLCNSKRSIHDRLKDITKADIVFYEGDIRDFNFLNDVFHKEKPQSVIHLAALKSVGQSVKKPLDYYDVNVNGTCILLNVMNDHGIKHFVYSSSATVYGDQSPSPLTEEMPTGQVVNPYGRTKYIGEVMLEDLYQSDNSWSICVLRYFNPVGAHESGLIGEDPKDIPNNLMPYVAKVAAGELDKVTVFGNDYDTPDGTGLRDYIHVVDLAKGHVTALQQKGQTIYNLGTGNAHSVLDVIKAYEVASGKPIPYHISNRREGDVAICFADCSKAKKELKWRTEKTLQDAANDSWRWITSSS